MCFVLLRRLCRFFDTSGLCFFHFELWLALFRPFHFLYLLGARACRLFSYACLELLHTASCVDNLLCTRVEGVAGLTEFDMDLLQGRTNLVGGATGAGDGGLCVVGWVNICFHMNGPSVAKGQTYVNARVRL